MIGAWSGLRYAAIPVLACIGAIACDRPTSSGVALASTAESFFRGVYGCEDVDLADFAAADARMSYHVFQERFGTPVMEGLARIDSFSNGFCSRWQEPEISIHESIVDSNKVVLVWSFSAVFVDSETRDSSEAAWGGISVFRFNEEGRIVAEYGEESTPGPVARMSRSASQ